MFLSTSFSCACWCSLCIQPSNCAAQNDSNMSYYVYEQCSTTCGLGAIWRTLACSTGSQSDCDPAKRPAPAQRCYLRPCSTWKIGEWSKVRLLVLYIISMCISYTNQKLNKYNCNKVDFSIYYFLLRQDFRQR